MNNPELDVMPVSSTGNALEMAHPQQPGVVPKQIRLISNSSHLHGKRSSKENNHVSQHGLNMHSSSVGDAKNNFMSTKTGSNSTSGLSHKSAHIRQIAQQRNQSGTTTGSMGRTAVEKPSFIRDATSSQ